MKKNTHLSILVTCVILLIANAWSFAQFAYPSPKFVETNIKLSCGEKLAFGLSNLPNPKSFGDANGNLEIQLNWQIGEGCNAGNSFSEKVKIKSTTHRFLTDFKVSMADDRKRIKITVSYIEPTGNDEMPAKGLIAASTECATLNIAKN